MNQEDLKAIVARVAEEVLKHLGPEPPKKRVLAILPGFVFNPAGVAGYLDGIEADAALFEGALLRAGRMTQMQIRTLEDRHKLAAQLFDYDEFVLVTPTLHLIRTLALGDDTVFEAMLALRPLLWGRTVTLLLDFEAPKYLRSTLFAELADALTNLEKTGMQLVTLACKDAGPDEPRDLVTEKDVKDAAKAEKKRVRIKEGAIVTQLAQDTARELGINIEY